MSLVPDAPFETAGVPEENRRRARLVEGGIFVALMFARLPYYATHHIQEDAFIGFRCAAQLASTGIYGFNPGERVSASSAHLFIFGAAILRLLTGPFFIWAVLIVNTALLVAGTRWLAGALTVEKSDRRALWLLSAISPPALVISYTGLETSLLVFLMGLALHEVVSQERPTWAALTAVALLPWVRPDAVAFGGILAVAFAWRGGGTRRLLVEGLRRFTFPLSVALAVGTASLLAFNGLYFGTILNQTIIAKMVALHPPHDLASIVERIRDLSFGTASIPGLFLPLQTRYLQLLAFPGLLLVLAACALRLWRSRASGTWSVEMVLAGWAFLPPLAYAFGGVIFSWYLDPSRLVGVMAVVSVLLNGLRRRAPSRRWLPEVALLAVLLPLAIGQWALSLNWGTQEMEYRAGIGRYIKAHSAPTDSILLEPLGYIPYFAERRAYDEVGLDAPEVTDYMRRFGPDAWWLHYLRDRRPTLLVEREDAVAIAHRLERWASADDLGWFAKHYSQEHEFRYDPQAAASNTWSRRILGLGSACNYYLFRYRP